MQSLIIQRASGSVGSASCGCRAANSVRAAPFIVRHFQQQSNWKGLQPKNLQLVSAQETSRTQASADDAFATAKRYSVSCNLDVLLVERNWWLTKFAAGLVAGHACPCRQVPRPAGPAAPADLPPCEAGGGVHSLHLVDCGPGGDRCGRAEAGAGSRAWLERVQGLVLEYMVCRGSARLSARTCRPTAKVHDSNTCVCTRVCGAGAGRYLRGACYDPRAPG